MGLQINLSFLSFLRSRESNWDTGTIMLTCKKDKKDNKDTYIRERAGHMRVKMFARQTESGDSV